jgi:hypothetical protein
MKIFKRHLEEEHELHFFDQVDDAKEAIEFHGPYDRIYLDHDLDGRIFVNSEEPNTGYQLAKFIAERGLVAEIILHSMNPFGSARMKEVLPGATRVYFDELFSIY